MSFFYAFLVPLGDMLRLFFRIYFSNFLEDFAGWFDCLIAICGPGAVTRADKRNGANGNVIWQEGVLCGDEEIDIKGWKCLLPIIL